MKKYVKYLLILLSFTSFFCLFSHIKGRSSLITAENNMLLPMPQDTTPLFGVKKTLPTSEKDLNDKKPIDLKDPSNIETNIDYDYNAGLYIFRTKLGGQDIATPFSLTQKEYMDYTLRQSMNNYFRGKNAYSDEPASNRNAGEYQLKDVKVNTNPLDRIFGPGGVKMQLNGYVEASMGIKNTKTDDPTLSEKNRNKTIFKFDEDIQVNANASVGDKINFGMNYDTKALFDFDSKRIKLGYTGDEDEIIKRIEAGNVSMSTTNSLIKGGTALFGINTELQFGKLRINSVISQQESENKSINTQGSIQKQEFEFKADQYDANRHFFLGHYFRDNYDQAMSKLPFVQSPVNITRIEVWITNKRGYDPRSRNLVAFADLAEHKVIKNTSKWFPTGNLDIPYNEANNLYSTILSSYSPIRDLGKVNGLFEGFIQGGQDYERVESARLLNTSEYSYNPQLGYISLNTALQADEVLAVAYEYKKNGMTYQVGEFSTDITDKYDPTNPKSGALFLKLLKPVSLSPRSYSWDLMMKNVYYLGAGSIQHEDFRLTISYQSDTTGAYMNYLPEGNIKGEMLLRVMNLDRLDVRQKTNPDGKFDYLEGYTIRSESGRVYFPVVEPFGSHLAKKIGNSAIAEKYVYQELYDSTLTIAQQIAEKNKFKISGSYRGSSSTTDINLNATNVPQGSVKVTAGGINLTEGVDFLVDYTSGTVTIINQNLIDSKTPVQVSLEDRTFSMQRKTVLGLNLSYDFTKDFNVGATIMHMSEKPLTTKTQIGNESVKNTLWGLNFSYRTQSYWLTNLIDKLPFVNATAPSQLSMNGEFAQMIAGHYQNDEVGAYSYLDDFETSESRIDIKNPYAWTLASTPYDRSASALFPEAALSNNTDYGKNRAMMAWFMIDGIFTRKNSSLTPQHIKNDKIQLSDHRVREVYFWEIYPDKDITPSQSQTMPVLNLSYYPNERGPYNLDATNIERDGSLKTPEKRWAGITRKMDVRDFEASNVEYIEFWMMDPFVYNGTQSTPNEGGDLYFNLGEISEDVLKDGKKFFENGLPVNGDPSATDTTVWGKVPNRQSTVYAFDDNQGKDARRKQDVGLNGLSTDEELQYKTYTNYLQEYRSKLDPDILSQQQQNPFSPFNDPARDNYHFYRGSYYDQNQTSILDRYKFYNGTEGNSAPTDDNPEGYSTAARNVPDVEDMDQDNTMNENEAYFQYKIQLKPDKMNVGDNFIVDKRTVSRIPLRDGTYGEVTWYQFRVPIRKYNKKVGNIQDFKSIRFIRMFLTNFKQNTFLRFATLQLVRGDWRSYEQSLMPENTPSGDGKLDISTVNIEEHSTRQPVNYVLPPGLKRTLTPDQAQINQENEQSLSLRITNLDAKDARAVYKNTFYDLRRYKRLQMFTHAEELINNTPLQQGDLSVFIRLGTDYRNNYYEYEIPLSITPKGNYNTSQNNVVWPEENMFDFALELLKNVKLNRNREKRKANSTVSYTTLYSEKDPDKPDNKISVIGNPSLAEVSVIMIGVRNRSNTIKSGEIWVNELRLTDFDEKGGWAAQGNVNLALSDLGTVNFSGRKETVGFGSLDQSLLERRQDDYSMYNIAVNVDLGRFIPEQAKTSIPLYYAYSNQKITPQYDPFDKDVTLKESLSLVDTKAEKDSIKSLAQERVTTKSFSLTNVKVNIQSKTPMPYDPANFTFGYSFNQSETKNPSTTYDIAKDYKLNFNYSYSPIIKTWEPFKNVKGNKGAKHFAKTLGFNYLPNNIAFNSNMSRFYTETLIRDIESYYLGGENNSEFLSWSQSFYWDRDFNLNWDFTRNLKMSFQSGTRAEIEEPYLQVNKKRNRDDYDRWKDSVMQSIRSLGDPLSYRQTAKVTYQVPFRDIPAMDWANTNLSYTSRYNWDRGAKTDSVEIGNTISNNITLDINSRFNLVSLYNKSGFLRKVNQRFDKQRTQSPIQKQREEAKKKRFQQEITLLPDTTFTLKHNLETKNLDIRARKDGKTYKLKYKRLDNNSILITNSDSALVQISIIEKDKSKKAQIWTDIAEYSARGLMSIRNLSVNYSNRKDTHISGFRPGVGDMFGQKNTSAFGMVPGIGFAFGFDGGENFIDKSLRRDWLVMNEMNITPAVYTKAEKLEIRSQIEPIRGLRIDLNAGRETNKRTEVEYMYSGAPRTLGGNFSMTTIALSSALRSSNSKNNYHSDTFEKFLNNRGIIKNRLEQIYKNTIYPSGGFISDKPGLIGKPYDPNVGEVNLNSADVLIPAFISAYTGRNANKVKLSAFPSLLSVLPNWTISYDGLTSISALRNKFKNIRLNHTYTCFYQVDNYNSFSSWVETGDNLGFIRDVLNGNPVPSSPYNISSVSIAEMFNPLFGVEGVLNNGMSINAQYNNMRTVNLNVTSYQIVESLQKEIVVGFGYRINEFNRMLGLTSRNANGFNNDLNIKADLSHKTNYTLIRKIEENFSQAISGTTVVTLKLSADYAISRSLTFRAFFDRVLNKPLITIAGYPTTNTNFGLSLKFTLLQ